MNISDIIVFSGMMLALAAVPSSSVILVIARSVSAGVSNGIAAAMGIVAGDLVYIVLAISGLHVMAETMGELFLFIKYLGAVYLICFGISFIRAKNQLVIHKQKTISANDSIGSHLFSYMGSFMAGLFLTLGDIKAIVFYASLFPVFIEPSSIGGAGMLQIMLITILSVGGVKVAYALFAQRLALRVSQLNYENTARKTIGGLMIGTGGYLMVKA